jgi:hypothetical protein
MALPFIGPSYPLTNGVRHSWCSVGVTAGGVTYGGVTEVNYAPKLDAQYVRGAGPLPIGTTTGLASMTADMTMLEEEFKMFSQTLGSPSLIGGGAGFMTSFFELEVQKSNEGYIEGGMSTITDTLTARITEVSAAMQASSGDALVRKMILLPIAMRLNGASPFPNMPSLSLSAGLGAGIGIARRILGI